MSISSLKLFKVAVPLKKVVRHASFERSVSENLVVRVTLSDGIAGYGEGVPRSYVTGETLESAFAALEAHDWAAMIGRPSSFGAGRRAAGNTDSARDRVRPARHVRQRRSVRPRAGDPRRLRPPVWRIGRASRRAGEGRWARRLSPPQASSLQRGHHGRIPACRANLGLEDADLRLSSGENQGRNSRDRMMPGGWRKCGGSWAGAWTSGSTPTRRGHRPS